MSAAGVAEARDAIRAARAIVVLTGAGISAESGVPTFRGAGGLWREHRAEDLATPQAFARDPRFVWEWYAWRRSLVEQCAPNSAHLALAELAERHANTTIVTQNVDELHTRAAEMIGSAKRPLELHGSIHRVKCSACGRAMGRQPVDSASLDSLPRCSACGALGRPDVVWFGESLSQLVIEAAMRAASGADVALVVGTSSVVYPAAGLADVTRDAGGVVIEVNPDATPLTSRATISIRSPATSVIPAIVDFE